MVSLPDTHTFLRQLITDGVVASADAQLIALTGGVSSEIYCVQDKDRRFVVKRALAKLKVAADWYADTGRNTMEQAYIQYVGEIMPQAVPGLIHANAQAGYFAMEYLDGYSNWKEAMLGGQFDGEVAQRAGTILGKIHAASWNDRRVAQTFDAIENFDQLRIDPYLRATAAKHPIVSEQMLMQAERLRKSRQCLMHGDYSPKNMLFRGQRLVVLDCEVACHGDAAFDLAFLLNHLLLKGMHHAPTQTSLPSLFETVVQTYSAQMNGLADQILATTAELLPMLLLARVDGKSPVEYLDPEKQAMVRAFALSQICDSSTDLGTLSTRWYTRL